MRPPKVSISVLSRDLGMSKIMAEVRKLAQKPYVKIGIQSDEGMHKAQDGKNEGAKTVAYIASVHEYGAPDQNIPKRSFIRSTMDENLEGHRQLADDLHDKILSGRGVTTEQALGIMGETIQAEIQAKIRSNIAPALKASTIRAKNRPVLTKAQSKINALEKKLHDRDLKAALRTGRGGNAGKLTKAELAQENKSSDLLATGGDSVALIDSSQMLRSIRYRRVMDGRE